MLRYETDDRCPRPSRDERQADNAVRCVVLILLAIALTAGWHESQAAITGTPYYRVTLSQGSSDVGYGQGTTEDAAWSDCRRLAGLPRALTAAETRRYAVAALTKATVRACKGPTWYVTVSPDPCPPAPAPRVQTCPTGTTGTWMQTATVGAAPGCAISWSPSSPTTGACIPTPTGERLTWNHDGANAAGFRIVYGASAQALTQVVQLNSGTQRSFTLVGLAPGTYFFAVKAFNADGAESGLSNLVTKVIQ